MKSKLLLLFILLLNILACGVATPTPTTGPAVESAQMNAVPDIEEEKPAPVPTPTFTPEPEPQEEIVEEKPSCVELLTPENEIEFGETAKVIFSWTAMDNTASYILNITLPFGNITTFESEETEITRYIEAFTQGGEYQWNVTALNAAGEEICSSDFFSFTKPETPQKPENAPKDNGGNSSGGLCWDGYTPIHPIWGCPPPNPDGDPTPVT